MRQCPKCNKRFLENNARICDVDGAVLDVLVVASERDRLIGTTILNRYAIDGVLGDGGMGVVYRAVDSTTGLRFAVKVLRAEYSAEEELVVRFEQEARAAAAIRNPHIVEIYDWGSLPDNSRFFVMEYLEGRSLGDVMARGGKIPGTDRRKPISEDLAMHVSMQIAEGLAAAHAIGVVHRDIKPDNFHLIRRNNDPNFVKILDFGIAKVQNSKAARTRTGSVFGTPHYMSPEQASGDRNIDATTDIYGLGVMMYEMVTGKVPFDADNLMGILTAHLYHAPTPPRAVPGCEGVSESLEAVILKCLAKTRDDRYTSMDTLRTDLERCRDGMTAMALDDQECSTVRLSRATLGFPNLTDEATRPDMQLPEAPPEPFAPVSVRPMEPFAPMPPTGAGVDTVSGVSLAPRPFPTAPPPRSRLPWVVAAVIGSGAVIGLAVAVLTGLEAAPTPAPTTSTVPSLAPPPLTLPPAPVVQHMAPSVAPPAPPLPVAPPVLPGVPQPLAVAPQRTVMLQSDAPGARVSHGGRDLGALPTGIPQPAAGDELYGVDAPGFDHVDVHVTPTTPAVMRVALPRHVHASHRDDTSGARHSHTGSHGHGSAEIHDPWAP